MSDQESYEELTKMFFKFSKRFILQLLLSCIITFQFFKASPSIASDREHQISSAITIGTEQNYPPYSYLDNNGAPTGFNIEISRAIAETLGITMKVDYRPWDEIRNDLLDHTK